MNDLITKFKEGEEPRDYQLPPMEEVLESLKNFLMFYY